MQQGESTAVIFEGQHGSAGWLHVSFEIDRQRDRVLLCSDSISPAVVAGSGEHDVGTVLAIRGEHVPRLVAALADRRPTDRGESGEPSAEEAVGLLVDRYRGNPDVMEHLAAWLREQAIPYEFSETRPPPE